MTYVPKFKCKFCGEERAAQVNGATGLLVLCDCKESREDWEKQHRIEMERRKRRKGGVRRN